MHGMEHFNGVFQPPNEMDCSTMDLGSREMAFLVVYNRTIHSAKLISLKQDNKVYFCTAYVRLCPKCRGVSYF